MFRKLLFWGHLIAGVATALVVAWMSLSGALLAFQPQVENWLRADLRRLEIPAGAERLSLEALRTKAEAERGGASATGISVPVEEGAAVAVLFGRSAPSYLHPWTGEILADPGASWAARFATLRAWHRWLAADRNGVGKVITGASNLAFVFLIVSGLYLWFPRKWSKRAVGAVIRFRRGLKGKARDFNWHHVIGFWCLPVLLILAVSGVVISYTWAHRLVYVAVGEVPPPPGRQAPPKIAVEPPGEGSLPLSLEALVERVRGEVPAARELRLSLGDGEAGTLAQHFTVLERGAFPPFASVSLALDPFDGEVVERSAFQDQSTGRRLRGWLRFLHTGEALGWPGQLVAMIASLAAVVLAWTGVALSVRRFLWWRKKSVSKAARSRVVATESPS